MQDEAIHQQTFPTIIASSSGKQPVPSGKPFNGPSLVHDTWGWHNKFCYEDESSKTKHHGHHHAFHAPNFILTDLCSHLIRNVGNTLITHGHRNRTEAETPRPKTPEFPVQSNSPVVGRWQGQAASHGLRFAHIYWHPIRFPLTPVWEIVVFQPAMFDYTSVAL